MWYCAYASIAVPYVVLCLCIYSGAVCSTVPIHRWRCCMWYCTYASVAVPAWVDWVNLYQKNFHGSETNWKKSHYFALKNFHGSQTNWKNFSNKNCIKKFENFEFHGSETNWNQVLDFLIENFMDNKVKRTDIRTQKRIPFYTLYRGVVLLKKWFFRNHLVADW